MSSVGVIRPGKLLPLTADGMKHACYFRHALALDERRVKFLPEYANGGVMAIQESSTPPLARSTPQPPTQLAEELPAQELSTEGLLPSQPKRYAVWKWLSEKLMKRQTPPTQRRPPAQPSSDPHPNTETPVKRKWPGDVKEVWFAGTHSDMYVELISYSLHKHLKYTSGGGNIENMNMSRKVPPLRWMVSEAKRAGLRMDDMRNEFQPLEKVNIIESLTGIWWFLEWLPIKRLAYTDKDTATRRFGLLHSIVLRSYYDCFLSLHRGQGRTICNGQKIDLSVCLTTESWVPKAQPISTDTIFNPKNLRQEVDQYVLESMDHYPQFLEVNQYERARMQLMRRAPGPEPNMDVQRQLGTSHRIPVKWVAEMKTG